MVRKNFFSRATVRALGECFMECLLHRKIWKVNPTLGYMHTAFAFGWFLLIVVGWVETVAYLGWRFVPLQGHIFFKFFTGGEHHWLVMDILLWYVLSGLVLAVYKRFRSRTLGMRRTTKLTFGDRVALSSLWFIFPLRLLAENFSGVMAFWWGYSIALGIFFVAMPFSRYMHIFTEVPLIFLRRWGIRSGERESSFDHFQLEACSRCGICIDPCQLQRDAGFRDVQSAYFIRDRRYNRLTRRVADNCLMCGRCEGRCPVGLQLDTLRLNSRHTLSGTPADGRFEYARKITNNPVISNECEKSTGQTVIASENEAICSNSQSSSSHPLGGRGETKNSQLSTPRIGFFGGCMTLLSPRILQSMEQIFAASGDDVWWADRNGGICCGRPLKLSGDIDAARDMMQMNTQLFEAQGITTLVTSCPICLRVFREDYRLEGIEVLHHSEYIARLIAEGCLSLRDSDEKMTYHDPCELGRGCGIYDAPRQVLASVGELVEPAETRSEALCCGSSLANFVVDDASQVAMARAVGAAFEATGAARVVTACPLCKKAIGRTSSLPTLDLAEVVAEKLNND